MQDEGFHEIQLNGKQLVFLFMAGSVVCVVIFLLGLMVGRGLPTARTTVIASEGTVDPTSTGQAPPPASQAESLVSAQETLTYAERLEAPAPLPETLRSEPVSSDADTPSAPPAAAPPAPVAAAEPPPSAGGGSFTEPPGSGFVVQVAAVNARREAETIAKALSSKGYPAFVTSTGAAGPKQTFRVRVGKYNDRREAEAAKRRLEQEEHFTNSWLTR